MAAPILRNVWLKFLSISIATLLWLVVAGDRVVERAVRVALEFENLPQGLEIVGEPPDTVDVRLRGPSGTIGALGSGDMAAVVDLRSVRPGRRLFHLTPSNVRVPYGVEVVQVVPSTLPVSFENSAVRIVQIRPSVEGSPAPGYEVAAVTATPSTAEVIGPESSLRGLEEAMTEPISVVNATRPIREVVTVGVADPSVRVRTPQTAEVNVQVVTGTSTRGFGGVPIEIRNLNNGLRARVLPLHVSVGVRGTGQSIEELTANAVDVSVDAAQLGVGEHRVAVRVRAPQGITVERVNPEAVRLRIAKP
jgi:YbbR domain-containing protein